MRQPFFGLIICFTNLLTTTKYINIMRTYIVKYTVSSDNTDHYCTLKAGDRAEIRNKTFVRFAQVNNLKGYKIIHIAASAF